MYVREFNRHMVGGKMRREEADRHRRRRALRPLKWQVRFNAAAARHGKGSRYFGRHAA